MDDKFLMENLLYTSKVLNDLYMHGVIESSNEKVMQLFNKAISETLKMHNELYKGMENVGFYSVSSVDDSKIKETKKKLECCCKESNIEEEE